MATDHHETKDILEYHSTRKYQAKDVISQRNFPATPANDEDICYNNHHIINNEAFTNAHNDNGNDDDTNSSSRIVIDHSSTIAHYHSSTSRPNYEPNPNLNSDVSICLGPDQMRIHPNLFLNPNASTGSSYTSGLKLYERNHFNHNELSYIPTPYPACSMQNDLNFNPDPSPNPNHNPSPSMQIGSTYSSWGAEGANPNGPMSCLHEKIGGTTSMSEVRQKKNSKKKDVELPSATEPNSGNHTAIADTGEEGGSADGSRKKNRRRDDRANGGDSGVRRRELGLGYIPRCQVDGCTEDLRSAKEYHRRHRVCEAHSKAPSVFTSAMQQRFCQQCSRFHAIAEFDDAKRSCRRRLEGHNLRRRKGTDHDRRHMMVNSYFTQYIPDQIMLPNGNSNRIMPVTCGDLPLMYCMNNVSGLVNQLVPIDLDSSSAYLNSTKLPYPSSSVISSDTTHHLVPTSWSMSHNLQESSLVDGIMLGQVGQLQYSSVSDMIPASSNTSNQYYSNTNTDDNQTAQKLYVCHGQQLDSSILDPVTNPNYNPNSSIFNMGDVLTLCSHYHENPIRPQPAAGGNNNNKITSLSAKYTIDNGGVSTASSAHIEHDHGWPFSVMSSCSTVSMPMSVVMGDTACRMLIQPAAHADAAQNNNSYFEIFPAKALRSLATQEATSGSADDRDVCSHDHHDREQIDHVHVEMLDSGRALSLLSSSSSSPSSSFMAAAAAAPTTTIMSQAPYHRSINNTVAASAGIFLQPPICREMITKPSAHDHALHLLTPHDVQLPHAHHDVEYSRCSNADDVLYPIYHDAPVPATAHVNVQYYGGHGHHEFPITSYHHQQQRPHDGPGKYLNDTMSHLHDHEHRDPHHPRHPHHHQHDSFILHEQVQGLNRLSSLPASTSASYMAASCLALSIGCMSTTAATCKDSNSNSSTVNDIQQLDPRHYHQHQ